MAVADPFGLIGQIIDGQVRIDEVIGEGGFSIVYKGEHLGLGEPVAVKVLKLSRRLDPKLADAFGKRFRDEGRLLYRLSQGSLHICRSITSGTCIAPASGMLLPYMVLEWLQGHSLVQEFRERRGRGKMPLNLEDAIALFDPAVQALAYAHSQGVVHRDVKPGNLIYTQTREGWKLKVLDFGLAKIFDDEAIGMQASVQTGGNFFMCSPSYGAPEQFDPRIGKIGPWTDVYAIALVFTESLADQKARHADSMAEGAILALSPGTKPTPRSLGVVVPDDVENILARAVALKPGDRPQTCGELWGALKEAVRGAKASAALGDTIMDDPAVVEARAQLADAMAAAKEGEPPPHTVKLPRAAPGEAPVPPVTQRISVPVAHTLPLAASPAWQASRERALQQVAAAQTAAAAAQAPLGQTALLQPSPSVASPDPQLARSPYDELAAGVPRRSRAPAVILAALVIVALMAAAAWGGYVLMRHRTPRPQPVGALGPFHAFRALRALQSSQESCPNSPT